MMLSVSEAARRAGRTPATIRRWIREGKLRARRLGTRPGIGEEDLEAALELEDGVLRLPPGWRRTFWGGPMPNWVAAVRRSRADH
jgi:excisionase family DNA binding protein